MSNEQRNQEREKIANMGWDKFEDKLQARATRGAGGSKDEEQAMRDYFGDEEFEELKKLAQQTSRTRAQVPTKGNIVFLPGIMGSNLVARKNRLSDYLVWVDLLNIVKGGTGWLKLSDDGKKEDDNNYEVRASLIDKRTYSYAILKLAARWDVKPFAFDWRRDIDDSSKALDEFIREEFLDKAGYDGKPVHLVAHSMGGLVCRNFIHNHKKTWDRMRGDGDGTQQGLLVMMGTPNHGSFAIPQVMTGDEKQVRWLSAADLRHSLNEILGIINTFVGSYLMLPSPAKIPAETREIYRHESWGKFPVSKTHLERALKFHEGLQDPATIDGERMRYIAGCNQKTISGLEIVEPGKFSYATSYEGDGRVPYSLGLLDGVPTYYVEEGHGRLPKNEKVIGAVEQLLEQGKTTILPTDRIRPRVAVTREVPWHRPVGEYLVQSEIEKIARKVDNPNAPPVSPEEVRAAEVTIMRALVGDDRPARRDPKPVTQGRKRRLEIEVLGGDITKVKAPVLVVGHYKGVTPINAIGAIDKKLDGWINEATKRSMIGGEVGQIFFIPKTKGKIEADSVLVGGMGEEGKFNRYDLRYMIYNVTYAIAALEVTHFATLVIGAGAGNLSLEHALRGMIFGICDALDRRENKSMVEKVTLVEKEPSRYGRILEALKTISREDSAANLDIEVSRSELPGFRTAPRGRRANTQATKMGPRITIERDGEVFNFSALAQNAVIPVRRVDIQSFYPAGISERLMESSTKEEQEMFGRLLCTSLIPEDFQQFYDTDDSLTLILDRNTASFPWEMACYGRPSGVAFFGTNLKLTRQFRTLLSAAPGMAPKLNNKLRVLVIADPAREPELRLPGARDEGHAVVRILTRIKQDAGLDIDIIDRIGHEECDPLDILGMILSEEFDVVHFAGHGIFDEGNPSNSGWVFGAEPNQPGKLRLLSAREVFRARRVPRLVFSNACFSAVVNKKIDSAQEMNKSLAGLAEAFFERGVQNYIGAGWPVQDDLAVEFATEFYAQALIGKSAGELTNTDGATGNGSAGARKAANGTPATLGEALATARKLILHNGSTWGAYQHYGTASDTLMKTEPAPAPAAGRKGRRAAAKAEATPAARGGARAGAKARAKAGAKAGAKARKGAVKSNGRKK